jgi:hypothetical protein
VRIESLPNDPRSRCRVCGHEVHTVERWPPAGCNCNCHLTYRSERAEADIRGVPVDELPDEDPEVTRLRYLTSVLADHAAAVIPDRPEDAELYQRIRQAITLTDRALSAVTGVSELPETQLLERSPTPCPAATASCSPIRVNACAAASSSGDRP